MPDLCDGCMMLTLYLEDGVMLNLYDINSIATRWCDIWLVWSYLDGLNP